MAVVILILLLGGVIVLAFSKKGLWGGQEEVADMAASSFDDFARMIRASMRNLYDKRRAIEMDRLNYTSAQLSSMPEPSILEFGLKGKAFGLYLYIRDVSDDGRVSLDVSRSTYDSSSIMVVIDRDLSTSFDKGQQVFLSGVLRDGDYDAFSLGAIWCIVDDARLDGTAVRTPHHFSISWPARPGEAEPPYWDSSPFSRGRSPPC